jgi:hypothetical protein
VFFAEPSDHPGDKNIFAGAVPNLKNGRIQPFFGFQIQNTLFSHPKAW